MCASPFWDSYRVLYSLPLQRASSTLDASRYAVTRLAWLPGSYASQPFLQTNSTSPIYHYYSWLTVLRKPGAVVNHPPFLRSFTSSTLDSIESQYIFIYIFNTVSHGRPAKTPPGAGGGPPNGPVPAAVSHSGQPLHRGRHGRRVPLAALPNRAAVSFFFFHFIFSRLATDSLV